VGRLAADAGRRRDRLDDLGAALGKRSWGDIEAAMEGNDRLSLEVVVETEEEGAALQRSLDAAYLEANRVAEELDEITVDDLDAEIGPLHVEAAEFVRNRWAVSWPWMAYHLVERWVDETADAVGGELGRRTQRLFWLASPEEMAVPGFETRPGERLGEARARPERETLFAMRALPTGRKSSPAIVDRYVGWWYRNKICHESIRRIAGGDERRKSVREGIDRAELWLSAARWIWRDDTADRGADPGENAPVRNEAIPPRER
jgi:hypothetical protein